MRSVARDRYKSGFKLNEQELRRIHDSLNQQMEKIAAGSPTTSKYQVQFHNGVISELQSLDEIFALENVGSAAIGELTMSLSATENSNESESAEIEIVFRNPDANNVEGKDSITYSVTGNNRDWVFVTSSELAERISRVKFFSPHTIGQHVWMSLIILLMLVFMAVWIVLGAGNIEEGQLQEFQEFEAIDAAWQTGTIDNIGDLILELERNRLQRDLSVPDASFIFPIGLLVLIGGLFVLPYVYKHLVFTYSFLWGDYVQVYERRRSVMRFILIVVVLGILLSVAGNYLSVVLGIT